MTLQEIHQRFFSFRNGIVAKAFHDAGAPHSRIFGLQLPQLAAIARDVGYDSALARQLWEEKECRESRLLACYLFDPRELTEPEALELASDIQSREEADILAWRLLRHYSGAEVLLRRTEGYMAEALARNLSQE